jgi:hypothetical protein
METSPGPSSAQAAALSFELPLGKDEDAVWTLAKNFF